MRFQTEGADLATLAVPVARRYGMPAIRRDGDPHFAVPVRTGKVDADGFVMLKDAAVIAFGVAPEDLQFAQRTRRKASIHDSGRSVVDLL